LPWGPWRWHELENLRVNDLMNTLECVPPACLVYYVENLDLPPDIERVIRQELHWQFETIVSWMERDRGEAGDEEA
jgi:hypothetical protein